MNPREAFLTAVEDENSRSFLDFINKHNSKNETFDIIEILQALSKKQHEKMWEGLKALCKNQILNATPSADTEEDDDLQMEKASIMLSCLQGITTIATFAISMDKPFIPSALFETAVILHGILMCLPEDSQKLQGSIAQLCETWFLNDLEGKEELITHTLPFLVIRSLAKGTVTDVRHILGLRQGFLLMDFEDENSESMKQLLQQCIIHPTFLRIEEGHRFLSFLFGIHPEFIKELHKTIKNQIPVCSMGVLSVYGEIYFRAWRVASGQFLEVIEKDCFQDLMYAAVHAQRTGTQSMASRLRKVLGYLHQQKKQQGVDETLVRLYQPIIWRAFKVANPMVRANAAALLIDAFPLQNPDANNEELDNMLQKQFDILQNLLEDPSPVVRATGIHGVCRISGVFWELIPVTALKNLLSKLICEVAFDASSSSVRVAVFQGLKFLLENHLSHPFLNTLLVNLRDLIHDNSEKVRAAFLDLLLLVKGLKAIKFWSVVPLEHLLARLEVEMSAPVIRKLVKLLMNSFHPLHKETDIQITRCTALWEANPVAARKFYQYAHLHTSVPATGKFILMLGQCLTHWAQSAASADTTSVEDLARTDSTDNNKENEGDEECDDAVLTLPDADTIAGILETIAISWAGIKDQLEKKANESIKAKLIQHFTKSLPKLLSSIEDGRGRSALVLISSHLPPNCLPAFSKRCLSTLSSLHDSVSTQDYGPMLDCLCSWGQEGDILDIIHTCVLNKMKGNGGVSMVNRDKRAHSSSKTPKLELKTALDLLSWLLYQPACREAVMNHHKRLADIASILTDVTNLIECSLLANDSTSRKSNSHDLTLYPKILKMYCHLQIHLHNKSCSSESVDAAESMTELLVWAERVLLPSLPCYSDDNGCLTVEKEKRTRIERSNNNQCCPKDILEVVISCSSELLKLGMADNNFCCEIVTFTKSLVQLGEKGLPYLHLIGDLMFQMSQRMIFLDVPENEKVTDYTQEMLTEILRAIAKNSSAENITQVLLGMKTPLAEVLKTYECRKQAVMAGFADRPQIMACAMAACLAEILEKSVVMEEAPTGADLPTLSSFVLGVLVKSKILLRSFTEELEQCIVSGAIHDIGLLASATFLLAVIVNANPKVDNLKPCVLQILEQVDQLQFDHDESQNDNEITPEQIKRLAKQTLEKLEVVC